MDKRGKLRRKHESSPFPLQWQTAKPTACKPETLGTTGHLLQRHEGGSGRCESGFAHSLQLGHSHFLVWNFDHMYEAQESYKTEYFWFWESWTWVVPLLKSANNHFQFLAFHIRAETSIRYSSYKCSVWEFVSLQIFSTLLSAPVE